MEDIRDEKAMEDLTAEEMSGKETAQEPEDQAVNVEPDKDPEAETDKDNEAAQGAQAEQDSAEEKKDPAGEQADDMGLFGKKKKDKKDEQIAELKDRVQRQMAEFDNFRKRTEREKAGMFEVGAKSVIEKVLPIVDNFERGLETTQEDSEDPFVVGMHKIYKQLLSTLEALDVKPIPAVGEEFNPDFHNAILHVEDDSVGENIIVEELQKGYMYRDSVVRHSMVKVAN